MIHSVAAGRVLAHPASREERLFVGDDWAEDPHDVFVLDKAWHRLASRRVPEGLPGSAACMTCWQTTPTIPAVIGIETDRSLWVQALVSAGYQVYAVIRWAWSIDRATVAVLDAHTVSLLVETRFPQPGLG